MDNLQEKINSYRMKKARNFSIAIMLYILTVAFLIGLSVFFNSRGAEIGIVLLFILSAVATGIIVFTNMSIPQEIIPYLRKNNSEYYENISAIKEDTCSEKNEQQKNNNENKIIYSNQNNNYKNSVFASIMKLYWLIVTIFYLGISFLTFRWDITWLIWLIAVAIEQAIKIIFNINKDCK